MKENEEMTLEEKFNLMCEALSISPERIIDRDITRYVSLRRNCIIHQLYAYKNHGLPELMGRTKVLIMKAYERFQGELDVKDMTAVEFVRLIDERLQKYIDGKED